MTICKRCKGNGYIWIKFGKKIIKEVCPGCIGKGYFKDMEIAEAEEELDPSYMKYKEGK